MSFTQRSLAAPRFGMTYVPAGEIVTIHNSLVTAIGKSLNYGGVSIPINLVYASNPDGNRISLICGYAITKVASR